MMDIVYILGSGSKWHNNELRYSLRSLERHFEYRNVFIIGERPLWLQNITHIDVQDSFPYTDGGKMKNAVRKIRAACQDDRISEDFVLMNDDFYFLRDCAEIKPFSLGTMQETLDAHRTKKGYYYNAIFGTMHFLKRAGIENPVSYGVHYPIVYNKERFMQMTDSMKWLEAPYLWRTMYGNLFNIKSMDRKDTKVNFEAEFEEFLAEEDSRDFLSSSDKIALQPKFQAWIEKRFPNPSRYEKPTTIRRLKTAKDIWQEAGL